MHNFGHDLVLRRNIRIAFSTASRLDSRPFAASTFGSHHVYLVSDANLKWNTILSKRRRGLTSDLVIGPVLPNINSGESFGIVESPHATTYGGLLVIKDELDDDLAALTLINDPVNEGTLDAAATIAGPSTPVHMSEGPLLVSASDGPVCPIAMVSASLISNRCVTTGPVKPEQSDVGGIERFIVSQRSSRFVYLANLVLGFDRRTRW